MKIRGLLLFVAGLVTGLVVPVGAQTLPSDPTENQLVIRSDGFIFLVRGGLRHLVSPIALTDEEINAFPEGEPYVAGLVPVEAMSAAPAGSFTSPAGSPAASPATRAPTSTSGTGAAAAVAPDPTRIPFTGELTLTFEDVPDTIKQGEKLKVQVVTADGARCEGYIRLRDGTRRDFLPRDTKAGRCELEWTLPADAREGEGLVFAKVTYEDKSKENSKTFEVEKK
jgi:hypothetical protein